MLTLTKPLAATEAAAAVSIDQTMRAKLPALPNPIVASWEERPRLVISRGAPWVIVPLEVDPYLTKAGGYPFPDAVARQLRRISEGGARFHRVAIAHEVDRHGPASALLPKVTGHGLALTPAQVKACLGGPPAADKPKALAARMDKAVKRVLGAAASASAAAVSLITLPMLDPIVFGVVGIHAAPATGQPAIFYPLAAWKW